MKEKVEEKRVTLIPENNYDVVQLEITSFTALRARFSIPLEKEMALKNNDGTTVQIMLPNGGYTLINEK